MCSNEPTSFLWVTSLGVKSSRSSLFVSVQERHSIEDGYVNIPVISIYADSVIEPLLNVLKLQMCGVKEENQKRFCADGF